MNHLVEKHSNSPYVDTIVVIWVENHLGSHILISSTECAPLGVYIFSRPTKVTEFDIEILIDEQIFRFDISMHNIVQMKILQCFNGLGEVNESLRLWEFGFRILVIKQIASLCIVQHHVNILLVQDGIPQGGNVGMVNLAVKLDLSFDEFEFVIWRNILQADNFYGVVFIGGCVNGELDYAKGTITEFLLLKNVKFFDVFEQTPGDNFH